MPPTYNPLLIQKQPFNINYMQKIYDHRFIFGLSTGILIGLNLFILHNQNISKPNFNKLINNMTKLWKHKKILLSNIPLFLYFLENKLPIKFSL